MSNFIKKPLRYLMFFLIVLTIFNAFAINHTQAQLPGVPQPVIVVNDVTAEVVDTRNWLKNLGII